MARQFIADFYYKMAQRDGKKSHKAIQYLEKCTAIDNSNAQFHFSLGKAFLREGLADPRRLGKRNQWVRKSADEFHKAIELEPSYSDYHFHLGISYGSFGYPPPFYWKIVQRSFERTAMLNPTNFGRLYSMGGYYLNEYRRLKNINQKTGKLSLANYDQYVAISKDNYRFFFMKLVDINREYLRKILEKCFSVTQDYADLRAVIRDTSSDHAFFARFLDGKGMWEEAEKEYREAVRLEPTNPIRYSNFAHALFRRGYYKDAIVWWQRGKKLDPRDERVYLWLANTFVKLKRFDSALRQLRYLVTLRPGNLDYRIKLIRTLLADHRLDEAIHEYHKVIEENPDISNHNYEEIRLHERQGNHSKAIKSLNKALSLALKK